MLVTSKCEDWPKVAPTLHTMTRPQATKALNELLILSPVLNIFGSINYSGRGRRLTRCHLLTSRRKTVEHRSRSVDDPRNHTKSLELDPFFVMFSCGFVDRI